MTCLKLIFGRIVAESTTILDTSIVESEFFFDKVIMLLM